jgi:hypothetical protein
MTTITLEIPVQWEDLLSAAGESGPPIPLELGALDWDGFVKELTENYPDLAKRLLSDSGGLAPGIAIAVNEEMFGSSGVLKARSFEHGDVVSVIIPFAGG